MFDQRYRAYLADTTESKKIHFQLRHQVYCVEKGFESEKADSKGYEFDIHDDQAAHFLVQDLESGQWVATLRVVFPGNHGLPITQIIDFDSKADLFLQGDSIAEISRLSILSDYRHAKVSVDRQSYPEILFGLIRAAKHYCEERGINNWLFLCRRSLKKIAERGGMEMMKIGAPCSHRGVRYPYLVDLNRSFGKVEKRSSAAFDLLQREKSFYRFSDCFPE